jgi:hypothetical protein
MHMSGVCLCTPTLTYAQTHKYTFLHTYTQTFMQDLNIRTLPRWEVQLSCISCETENSNSNTESQVQLDTYFKNAGCYCSCSVSVYVGMYVCMQQNLKQQYWTPSATRFRACSFVLAMCTPVCIHVSLILKPQTAILKAKCNLFSCIFFVYVLWVSSLYHTSIPIIVEGRLQVFQRFFSSKLVLKPLKAVSQPSINMGMAVVSTLPNHRFYYFNKTTKTWHVFQRMQDVTTDVLYLWPSRSPSHSR